MEFLPAAKVGSAMTASNVGDFVDQWQETEDAEALKGEARKFVLSFVGVKSFDAEALPAIRKFARINGIQSIHISDCTMLVFFKHLRLVGTILVGTILRAATAVIVHE
jgi:hypothetical protein